MVGRVFFKAISPSLFKPKYLGMVLGLGFTRGFFALDVFFSVQLQVHGRDHMGRSQPGWAVPSLSLLSLLLLRGLVFVDCLSHVVYEGTSFLPCSAGLGLSQSSPTS